MTKILIYREVRITGDTAALERFLAQLEADLPPSWSKIESMDISTGIRVHSYMKHDYGADGLKIVLQQKAGQIFVSHLLPQGMGESLRPQSDWNEVIEQLFEQVFEPIAKKAKVNIDLEAGEVELTNYLSEETYAKLRTFSAASYGTSHPCDQERWYSFLFAAHEEQADDKLTPELLRRWLRTQNKWSEDDIEEMADRYEDVLFLLDKYDRHRAKLSFWP